MKRFLALILAVAVIGGFATASQARTGRAHDEGVGVELTYTKWFAPGFPNMVGDVGGDIVGKFGGAVIEEHRMPPCRFVQLTAVYIVIASDPAQVLHRARRGRVGQPDPHGRARRPRRRWVSEARSRAR